MESNDTDQVNEEDCSDELFEELYPKKNIRLFNSFKLCDILIEEEFVKYGHNTSIGRKRFEFLAEEIEKLFPSEKQIRYDSAPLGTSINTADNGHKVKEAKGLLANRHKCMKNEFARYYGERTAKPSLKRKIDISDQEFEINNLRGKTDIDEAFLEEWERIGTGILKYFSGKSLSDILDDLPTLCLPTGYSLFESVYNIFLGSSSIFFENLAANAPLIIKVAKFKATDSIKSILVQNKKIFTPNIPNKCKNDISTENNCQDIATGNKLAQQNLALFLLPEILGRQLCFKSKAKDGLNWNATIPEVIVSFIKHCKVDPDNKQEHEKSVNEHIGAFNSLYVKYRQSPLPFVIIVGTLENVKQSYVVVGRAKYTLYGVDSGIKAVDLCFKCAKVLRKHCPIATKAVWQFIEYYLYKVNTKLDDLKYTPIKKKHYKSNKSKTNKNLKGS